MRWIALLLPFVAAFCAFAPALGANLVADDWAILALARHGAPGWAYFFTDHTAAYSYRPNGMLIWHLVARLFGDAAAPQYAVQFALHGANASLLTLLLMRLQVSPLRACLFGLVFALHPVAFGTALWLADRYDLVAVNGTLLLLLALDAWRRHLRGSLVMILLAAAWAAGAKETALAALPAALVWILMSRDGRRPGELVLAAGATALPFALALLVRWWIFGSSGVDLIGSQASLLDSLWQGCLYWLGSLPGVLLGFRPGIAGSLAAGLLLAACVGLALIQSLRRGADTAHRMAAVGGVLLLLAPALPQAPITSIALATELPHATTMRFFYLSLTGLLICLSRQEIPALWARRILGAAVLVAVAIWGAFGLRSATDWRLQSATPAQLRMTDEIARALRDTTYRPGCAIYVENMPLSAGDLRYFIDPVAKSSLEPGAANMKCLMLTQLHGTMAITSPLAATPGLPDDLPTRVGSAGPIPSRAVMLDRLQVHYPGILSPEEAHRRPATRVLQWTGSTFVETRPMAD